MEIIRLFLQIFCINVLRLVLIIFGDFRIRGVNNLKGINTKNGVIFASNHSSQLDVLMIPAALPYFSKFLPIYYVSLESKFYKRFPIGKYFYGGWFFSLMGGITAPKGLKSYPISLKNHVEVLRRGGSLCIFPEGQVIPGKGVGPAKGGVGYLAEATGATIIPVALNDNHDMNLLDFILMRRNMSVVFGKPTNFDELYNEVLVELKERGIDITDEVQVKNLHKVIAQKLMDKIFELIKRENGSMLSTNN